MNYTDLFYYYGFVCIIIATYFIFEQLFKKNKQFIDVENKTIKEISDEAFKSRFDTVLSLSNIVWFLFGCFTVYRLYFITIILLIIFSGVMTVLNNKKTSQQSHIFYLSNILLILLTLIIINNHFNK